MTLDDIAQTLRERNESRQPLSVKGGGTLAAMGAPCAAPPAVELKKLNRLVAHEHADLTCSVQAGMTLNAFAKALAERGQFVPLDAPLRAKATVGGTLAAGWLGPRRHRYGKPRDLAIGSQVVLADGTVANAGGMVVKNVSGYDMTKLYIGSFGTLGVITRANFKTMPVPRARRMLIASLPERSRDRAVQQAAHLAAQPAMAVCVEGFGKAIAGEDGVDGRILLLFEGSASYIERATRDARSALGRAGVPETYIIDAGVEQQFERVLDACVLETGERSIAYRSLGTPDSAQERATKLRDAANRHELFTDVLLDVMNGDVFVNVSERDARAFAQKIEACDDDLRAIDPHSVIVAGRAPIRASLEGWGKPPAAIEKMREIKARFDPNNILNPGRFVGGI
jgi:glycolate oxidase FAD binding subunit